MSTIPGFLTAHEAAEALSVSHAQATRYLTSGRLKGRKVGNQWLVEEIDLKNFTKPEIGNPDWKAGIQPERKKSSKNKGKRKREK